MQQQKIEFRKERDFSSVLGDSIKFLKQNFKPLLSSIILVTGPIILLTGLAYSYMQTVVMAQSFSGLSGFGMFNETYFISLGSVYLLMFINTVLLNSVVYNYMCLYNEKPAGEKIMVSEVASRVWQSLGLVMGSILAFLVLILVLIAFFVLIGIGVGIGSGGNSLGAGGVILIIFLVFFLFFGILILAPIIAYMVSAGFYVVVRDKKFIFRAFGTVRRYLSGNFWWTWLIMVVALIALSILQLVFNLPATIMMLSQTFTRLQHIKDGSSMATQDTPVLLIVFYTVGLFLTTCSSSIIHIVCAFNFLGQEEKHEGKGLLSRMDEIK